MVWFYWLYPQGTNWQVLLCLVFPVNCSLIRYRFYLLFISGCAESLLLRRLFSSCGARASHYCGFCCCGTWVLGHAGSAVVVPGLWSTGSIAVAHRLRCSMAWGIFLDQGLNLCLLHWQTDSLSLNHQGCPRFFFSLKENPFMEIPWGYSC